MMDFGPKIKRMDLELKLFVMMIIKQLESKKKIFKKKIKGKINKYKIKK
jgi:hypothetical protein